MGQSAEQYRDDFKDVQGKEGAANESRRNSECLPYKQKHKKEFKTVIVYDNIENTVFFTSVEYLS